MNRFKNKRCLPWLAAAALFLSLGTAEWYFSRSIPTVGAPLRQAAQGLSALLSRGFGLLPFPFSEWCFAGLVLGIPLWFLINLLRKNGRELLCGLCRILCLGAAAFFLFVFLFLVQHSAPPLARQLGLEPAGCSVAQLEEYVAFTVAQVNGLAGQVPRNEAGDCAFGDFAGQARLVQEEYLRLAATEPAFAGLQPAPGKRSLLGGRIMSYIDLAGYYFPYTGEQIVSSDVVDSHIPFNLAHEGAHARGIGPEAEANFTAWLVLCESDDLRLRYSAWFNAYIYANNALYEIDPAAGGRQYADLDPLAQHDCTVLNESLRRFEGRLNDAGSAVNDAYIKATGQPDGIRSYGRVVDLLLAYYYENYETQTAANP